MGDIRVIDLLVHDMMHTQYAPEGECCVCVVAHTKRSITITYTLQGCLHNVCSSLLLFLHDCSIHTVFVLVFGLRLGFGMY